MVLGSEYLTGAVKSVYNDATTILRTVGGRSANVVSFGAWDKWWEDETAAQTKEKSDVATVANKPDTTGRNETKTATTRTTAQTKVTFSEAAEAPTGLDQTTKGTQYWRSPLSPARLWGGRTYTVPPPPDTAASKGYLSTAAGWLTAPITCPASAISTGLSYAVPSTVQKPFKWIAGMLPVEDFEKTRYHRLETEDRKLLDSSEGTVADVTDAGNTVPETAARDTVPPSEHHAKEPATWPLSLISQIGVPGASDTQIDQTQLAEKLEALAKEIRSRFPSESKGTTVKTAQNTASNTGVSRSTILRDLDRGSTMMIPALG